MTIKVFNHTTVNIRAWVTTKNVFKGSLESWYDVKPGKSETWDRSRDCTTTIEWDEVGYECYSSTGQGNYHVTKIGIRKLRKDGPFIHKWGKEEEEKKEEPKKSDKVPKGVKFFLSHIQRTSGALALDLWHKMGKNKGAWLDVKNPDGQGEKQMMKGVTDCSHFVIILSKEYFDSKWCLKEVKKAMELKKKFLMVFNTDQMAKKEIGALMGKGEKLLGKGKNWPSALPMSTDETMIDAMFAQLMKHAATAEPL